MRDLCFIDLETTGLHSLRRAVFDTGAFGVAPHHEIIEIGALRVDTQTLEVRRQMRWKVQPERIELAAQQALTVNGYTASEWSDAVPLSHALIELSELANNACFAAWNMTFDWSFLRIAFAITGVENTAHYHRLCVMSMYAATGGDSLSLSAACEALGIEPEADVHRALAGATKCFEVYKAIREQSHA